MVEVNDYTLVAAERPAKVAGAWVATYAQLSLQTSVVVDFLLEGARPVLLAPVAAIVGAADVERLGEGPPED